MKPVPMNEAQSEYQRRSRAMMDEYLASGRLDEMSLLALHASLVGSLRVVCSLRTDIKEVDNVIDANVNYGTKNAMTVVSEELKKRSN